MPVISAPRRQGQGNLKSKVMAGRVETTLDSRRHWKNTNVSLRVDKPSRKASAVGFGPRGIAH